MLIKTLVDQGIQATTNCDKCGGADADILMIGYGDDKAGDCNWCGECAMQLARMLMEDLCELKATGGRYGG
ncbi:MAG: hypothetical protein ABSF97_01030 [Candidatus Sulfotelmatobacter sp.]|jgi:hypothetical protein